MISFYKDDAEIVMFKDDSYLNTMLFVIERPATNDDAEAHPEEHAVFVASTTPVPAAVDPALTQEGTV